MRTKNIELMNKIIEFVDSEYSKKGRTPTMQDIAIKMQITKGCVSNYIREMSVRKLIVNNGGSRGIMTKTMLKSKKNIVQVPVVGSIACGFPLLAEENIDFYIPISKEYLGNGKYFILKANGDSMINANISDGDFVIIRQQEQAEEGQIVVALINDEATLKRFYLEKNTKRIKLHPENEKMRDMFFDNIIIQGVAIKVIKDLI